MPRSDPRAPLRHWPNLDGVIVAANSHVRHVQTKQGGEVAPPPCACCDSEKFALRLLDRLGLDRDLDLVADRDSAGLERNVPGEREILAIDRRFGAVGNHFRSP